MVERYRPPKPKRQGFFKPGHKRYGGRVKGEPNHITTDVKLAIMKAIELCGSDTKGKDGAVGYLYDIACNEKALMVRLVEKIIPTQITGPKDGPLQVFSLPQEMLKGLTTDQLNVMETVFTQIGSGVTSPSRDNQEGDASVYAQSIGLGTKH